MIVSHFAYLYNRDKEGRKSRALELLTGQHSGNSSTSHNVGKVRTPESPGPMIYIFLKNVRMDIISTKIQKVPKPVSNQTQQNLTAATKILNLYFLIATINLFKLSNFWFIFFFYFVLFQVTLGHLRSFEVGVGEQGHRKSRQLCLVLWHLFSENLDIIRTADGIETDRIRTDRHRTVNPDRIRTADRHLTWFSGKSG